MRLTVKDVGQGDSIILEWNQGDQRKVAFIDCSKKGGRNPVLDFIKESGYTEIEFAVLSHPHHDHYSGYYELFEHCKAQSIEVKKFYHTIHNVGRSYWSYFEVGSSETEQLRKMMLSAWDLHKMKLTEISQLEVGNKVLDVAEDFYMKCLAPSHDEILRCQEIMNFDPSTHKKQQSSSANYLSTVFKLRIGDDFYLLTSDAEKLAFNTILDRRSDEFEGIRLIFAQMPHHGSHHNHEEAFWAMFKIKPLNPAVASAGNHASYDHPHFETLMAFHAQGFRVYSTTNMNGVKQYLEEMRRKGDLLDTVSEEALEHDFLGDQVFELTDLLIDS